MPVDSMTTIEMTRNRNRSPPTDTPTPAKSPSLRPRQLSVVIVMFTLKVSPSSRSFANLRAPAHPASSS